MATCHSPISSNAGINFIQNNRPSPLPPEKDPGHNLKEAKTLPQVIIVYKNPPLGTEQGVKSPTPGT